MFPPFVSYFFDFEAAFYLENHIQFFPPSAECKSIVISLFFRSQAVLYKFISFPPSAKHKSGVISLFSDARQYFTSLFHFPLRFFFLQAVLAHKLDTLG